MNITFLGGTGFVGSNLVNQLSNTENNITILTRSREKNKNMLVYPKVKLVETDVHNADELTKHTKNSEVLILGLTYKANCPDLRNSQVANLINFLKP